jgi:NAD+ kinase
MATVAVMVHPVREDAHEMADKLASWLAGAGHDCRRFDLSGDDRVRVGKLETHLGSVDLGGSDLAISLGGDGTFLRLVPFAHAADVPIMGVNFGRLGYMLELQPDDLMPMLERALGGDVPLSERCAVDVSVSDRSLGGPWLAFNEVVLEKTVFGHTVRLASSIDGEEFLGYSADGLLVATPTGSTAYNLSAGGPVLSPAMRAMVMTPVAPHLTVDRSIVVGDHQTIRVVVQQERPAALVVDGLEVGRLSPGAEVTCRVAARPVRLVVRGEGFATTLRSTLARRHAP